MLIVVHMVDRGVGGEDIRLLSARYGDAVNINDGKPENMAVGIRVRHPVTQLRRNASSSCEGGQAHSVCITINIQKA